MKKSTTKKPLRLATETVRTLETVAFAQIAGGVPTTGLPTRITCGTMCTCAC